MATQSSAPRDGKYPYGSDLFRRISNLETANAGLAETNRRLRADLQRLQKLAYLDPLTGLGNRRYFACCIDSELRRAARTHSPTALIICDIDEFKRYNDRYGHCGGDAVLIAVGATLKQFCRRGGDLAIRRSGTRYMSA
jgi:PleD family two-component response regulator